MLTSANFETSAFYDPKTDSYLSGWRDHSGLENHLVIRSGSVTYETRDGVEGAIFDGTLLASMRQYLMMGAGTLSLSFSDGYKANTSRSLVTLETFDATVERTGNPAWVLWRYVGSGSNRTYWGTPSSLVNVTLAGASSGDDTIQRAAYYVDMNGPETGGKLEGATAVSTAPSETFAVVPRGADLVFGRLDQTVADADRVALTGSERLWLSHVQMWGNFQTGNLIESYPDELEALFTGMAV
jgi:hypothetical protein